MIQSEFILEFDFTNTIYSDRTLRCPITNFVGTVDWGDGSALETYNKVGTNETLSHHYDDSGLYTVKFNGTGNIDSTITDIALNHNFTTRLTQIINWGNNSWGDFITFIGCTALTTIHPMQDSPMLNNVQFVGNMFQGCTALTTIPEDFLKNNSITETVSRCFMGCTALTAIPLGLFRHNTILTNFSYCFEGCTSLQSQTPTTVEGFKLWERQGQLNYPATINGNRCFYGCTLLPEYSIIPEGSFFAPGWR